MATTQIADVIVPSEFTNYLTQDSTESMALVQAGILTRNAVIEAQLRAGADSFNVPYWLDVSGNPDIVSDDPTEISVPGKLGSVKQTVRKAYLAKSWSAMALASQLAGSDALGRIQERVGAYWNRHLQTRLIATMNGVLADNETNHAGDMVLDITGETGDAAKFSAEAVIDAAGTMGDKLEDLSGICLHGDQYRAALKADLIQFLRPSDGSMALPTFRGLLVVQDDGMPYDDVNGDYVAALFGPGAFSYGMAAPQYAAGTEIENLPSAGNGGGQSVLHTRICTAVAPAGYSWTESSVAAASPSTSELELPANWLRTAERRAIPLAFLKSKL